MIDLKQELQNYPFIDIKGLEENRPDLPDNYKNSVILYNKALESIRSGSEDIAIIELKKAVSLNPDFHEAINLLGLCYSSAKDYAKAEEMFRRVINAENNSVRAMEYMNALEGRTASDASGINKTPKRRYSDGKMAEKHHNSGKAPKNTFDWKVDTLKFTAGLLAGIVIMVIINFLISDKAIDSTSFKNDSETTQTQSTAETEEKVYQAKFNELEEKYKLLEDNFKKANQSIDYYKNVTSLFEVERLSSSGDYRKAADLLILLKPVAFQGVEKEKFDQLSREIMPKAAKEAYNQGVKLFKEEKFQEALDMLSKAKIYGAGLTNVNMGGILYNLGKCYMELEDYTNAISAFTSVINDYPDSGYVKYSKNWIEYIESRQ